MDVLKRGFNSLFFPSSCAGCGKALLHREHLICLPCIGNLPLTNSHLEKDNLVERIFWGRIRLENACSLVYFKQEGIVQHIMHQFKYKGKKEIGNILGSILANQLKNSDFISSVDLILPVPIHAKKKALRGYNQSDNIAEGMANILHLPWQTSAIKKEKDTESQTKKKRYERWKNVEKVFKVIDTELLKNKHILLVDDVLTTGSTLEACGTAILKVPGTKLSIATIAVGL